MQKQIHIIAFFIALLGIGAVAEAQPVVGRSNSVTINFGYPLIEYDASPTFNDVNDNNTIDVGESVLIAFNIRNKGKYVANNVTVQTQIDERIPGLQLPAPKNYGNIAPGGERFVKLVIKSDSTLAAGVASLKFNIIENADSAGQIYYAVNTADVARKAKLRFTSHKFFTANNRIAREKPFTLRLDLQNLGNSVARELVFDFDVPKQVLIETPIEELSMQSLQPGEIREIKIEMLIGINYFDANVPIKISVTEKTGQSRDIQTVVAKINAFR
ncbi:MAG: hypothetical protein AAF824_01770 [Bacteroidota bacterium]